MRCACGAVEIPEGAAMVSAPRGNHARAACCQEDKPSREWAGRPPEMTRTQGERLRVLHTLQRLRTIVDQVIADLERGAPTPGPDVAQAVAHTGVDVARLLSRLDAFDLAERDATGGGGG